MTFASLPVGASVVSRSFETACHANFSSLITAGQRNRRYVEPMTLQFDCVFYYVSDLERAVAFYENALGFKLESKALVARFELDGVCLELVPTKHTERYRGAGNARLCLRVDNMNAERNDLMRLGVMSSEPVDEGAGLLSSIHDLDGNEICLWEEKKTGRHQPASLWAD